MIYKQTYVFERTTLNPEILSLYSTLLYAPKL